MAEGIIWLENLKLIDAKKIICLIDGEHHPEVTRWAVNTIKEHGGNIVGLVFAGGTEKIRGEIDRSLFTSYPCSLYSENGDSSALFSELNRAVEEHSPDLVIDLSDMPVTNLQKRFKIASHLLAQNVPYAGADFVFAPPARTKALTKPSITILGTGKRVGKTAVSVTVANILKNYDIMPSVVAMGRGGPSKPRVVDLKNNAITPDYLLDIVEQGDHAASDYWENAVFSGITTIGCRRCGGGMAGNPFISNVPEGVALANNLPADLIIMEGSGPTFPPVKTDGTILVVGAHQKIEDVTTGFDEYRLLSADLVIVTMCEPPLVNHTHVNNLESAIRRINPGAEVALTVFRPEPVGEIRHKKVFLATTSPERVINGQITYLEGKYDCSIVGYSSHLSNRKLLEADLQKMRLADLLLTELKAAAVDTAVKTAKKLDKEIAFLHNRVVLSGGTIDSLDQAILEMCKRAGLSSGQPVR